MLAKLMQQILLNSKLAIGKRDAGLIFLAGIAAYDDDRSKEANLGASGIRVTHHQADGTVRDISRESALTHLESVLSISGGYSHRATALARDVMDGIINPRRDEVEFLKRMRAVLDGHDGEAPTGATTVPSIQFAPEAKTISIGGKPYPFSERQYEAIRFIYESAHVVTWNLLRSHLETKLKLNLSASSRLPDVFKGNPHWKKFIKRGGRGVYEPTRRQ